MFSRAMSNVFALRFWALTVICAVMLGLTQPAKADPPISERVVKRTLPNGLRVLVLPRRTAPVVTTMLWYRVGARDEVPGSTGAPISWSTCCSRGPSVSRKATSTA